MLKVMNRNLMEKRKKHSTEQKNDDLDCILMKWIRQGRSEYIPLTGNADHETSANLSWRTEY